MDVPKAISEGIVNRVAMLGKRLPWRAVSERRSKFYCEHNGLEITLTEDVLAIEESTWKVTWDLDAEDETEASLILLWAYLREHCDDYLYEGILAALNKPFLPEEK